MLKTRLQAVEKALGLVRGPRTRLWLFISHGPKEAAAKVQKIKAGKIPAMDGGRYSPEDHNIILDICPAKMGKAKK